MCFVLRARLLFVSLWRLQGRLPVSLPVSLLVSLPVSLPVFPSKAHCSPRSKLLLSSSTPTPPKKDNLTVFPPEGNPSPHGSLTASHFVPQPVQEGRLLQRSAPRPAWCWGADISPGQQHCAATEVLFPWLGAAAGDEPSSPHGFLEGAGLLSAGSPTRLGARTRIRISL